MRFHFFIALAVGLSLPAIAVAQSGGPISLRATSIGSGGSMSNGPIRINGTVGQEDAGKMTAPGFVLFGGFGGPSFTTVDVPPREEPVPSRFVSFGAAPNPARGDVRFTFDLPQQRRVSVHLFSTDGRLVRTLLDGDREPGRYVTTWDGHDENGRRMPAGVYFARIVAGESTATHRFVRLD